VNIDYDGNIGPANKLASAFGKQGVDPVKTDPPHMLFSSLSSIFHDFEKKEENKSKLPSRRTSGLAFLPWDRRTFPSQFCPILNLISYSDNERKNDPAHMIKSPLASCFTQKQIRQLPSMKTKSLEIAVELSPQKSASK